jgi:hypothetical protein
LSTHPQYLGSREWLAGFLVSQKYYLAMARAGTEAEFGRHLEALKTELGHIAMWKDFAERALSPALAADHIKYYWRGPLQDPNIVGLPKQ